MLKHPNPTPEQELEKVARKLRRLTTERRFYKPAKIPKYKAPAKSIFRGYLSPCNNCGRMCQGKLCRECNSKETWRKYNAKVAFERARLKIVKAALGEIIKRKD